ncbi:MAG: hypothetical protein C0592_07440 [Marinilabiliales bacterium]|nr:MAG: hypothetical protein C0592_07440 [Marinilabiliales bacterium]
MKASREYRIAFRGLSDGSHDFHWEVGKSFFESDPDSGIRDASISVDMTLTKSNRLFELNFVIKGRLTVGCDRCLDDLELGLDINHPLIVRESERGEESNDDILFITSSDYELDMAQIVYELILLSMPMRKVHDDGQCNEEMMERFKDIIVDEAEEDL